MIKTTIDLNKIKGWEKAFFGGRDILIRNIAAAFQQIGRHDIETLKASLTAGGLNIRSKGLRNSFKAASTDPAKAKEFRDLFLSEYTGWKSAGIFQTGGTITGKDGLLTVLFSLGKNRLGKRNINQAELLSLIRQKLVRFVPTPRGVLIVLDVAGATFRTISTGGYSEILGIAKKSVNEKKRLNFDENFDRNDSFHQQCLEQAVTQTIEEMEST